MSSHENTFQPGPRCAFSNTCNAFGKCQLAMMADAIPGRDPVVNRREEVDRLISNGPCGSEEYEKALAALEVRWPNSTSPRK